MIRSSSDHRLQSGGYRQPMIVMSHLDPILAVLNPTALICCIHLLQVRIPSLNTDRRLMSNVVHRYVGTHCMSIKGRHKTTRNNKAVIPRTLRLLTTSTHVRPPPAILPLPSPPQHQLNTNGHQTRAQRTTLKPLRACAASESARVQNGCPVCAHKCMCKSVRKCEVRM